MEVQAITKDNFDDIIAKNNIVLVDFWAEWCGPCKQFSPIFAACAAQHPHIFFGTVNIEAQPELAQDFNVRTIPQLMVFKEGVAIFAESGLMPASALQDLIQQAEQVDMGDVHRQIAKEG